MSFQSTHLRCDRLSALRLEARNVSIHAPKGANITCADPAEVHAEFQPTPRRCDAAHAATERRAVSTHAPSLVRPVAINADDPDMFQSARSREMLAGYIN